MNNTHTHTISLSLTHTHTHSQMLTTESATMTADSTQSPSSPAPTSVLPMEAIIGIAAGGGALLVIVVVGAAICCCYCCCSCNKSEDYVPDKPFMVVRTYDQNYAPDLDRSASLISNRSRANSLRSSISSIASSIRSSIRRLSRRNRAYGGGEGPVAMKVTPLWRLTCGLVDFLFCSVGCFITLCKWSSFYSVLVN